MNYDQALKIAADHASDLHIDPEVPGQPHICVRAHKDGAPFSIMLPVEAASTGDAELDAAAKKADAKAFTDALDAASKHLGVSK